MGSRLGRSLPKPLTALNDGRTIMQQQFDNIAHAFGKKAKVTIVVGYKLEHIIEAFPNASFVYNEQYDQTNTSKSLMRALRETPGEQVVGFVDDDPSLWRRRLQGVPVLGSADESARIVIQARPDQVIVTIPRAPRERLDFVADACAQAGIPYRVLRQELDPEPTAVLRAEAD